MDDFVRDKLTEWGLLEWIQKFEEEGIDKENVYCLKDQEIAELIPKVGPRAKFKERLKLLKKEPNTANPDTADASAQVIPSTSGTSNEGKRKSDLQGESNQQQSPTKKQRLAKEEIILADVKEIMGCVLKKIPPRGNNLNNFLRRKIHDLETDKREVVGVFGKTGAGKSSLINAVIGLKKFLPSGSDEELSEKFIRYTRTKPDDAEDEGTTRWYWPLVKCVTIKVPNADLLKHVTLVDLPGNGDTNKSTDKIWKTVVGSCSTIWIVADINQAASDKKAWDILKDACSYMGNGGQCNQIHFICTKSDEHDSEDTSEVGIRDFILKRNLQAKKEVKKEFNQLKEVKKHFSEESFKVFTVSSVEFLNQEYLNQEETEIPKLQEFLQELNDCHRETLNYVSGARGILSLIQGASHRGGSEIKEDVCTILEEKMRDELEKVHKQMEETYQAFEKCLIDGVEKSESYCEKVLESVINPIKQGSGSHMTVRYLVEHHGIYKAKKGQGKRKQKNLNMELSSYLTESIEDKFKETFPNKVNCGAFNGKLNSFSLDTKTMKMNPEYKDVELQLEFLNAEEVKMKKKLVKIILDRKKTIYSSLMTTVEESMQKCYEDAKGIRGTHSLNNMRETMRKHVHDSKNIMFKNAKKVMLNQLRDLMDDILKDLKETMQESIELSLKTDGYSIPDVAVELDMVKNHCDELNGSAEEDQ